MLLTLDPLLLPTTLHPLSPLFQTGVRKSVSVSAVLESTYGPSKLALVGVSDSHNMKTDLRFKTGQIEVNK
jgi:hypothetical protein